MEAVSCVFGSYLRSGMAQPPAAPRPVRPYGTPEKFNGGWNSDFVAWEQYFGQVNRVNQWTAQDEATYIYILSSVPNGEYPIPLPEHPASDTGQRGQCPASPTG